MKKRNTRQPAATPDTADRPEPGAAPVTPPDVLSQACACCGAILPAPLSRLDAIPGQEHLRRAVTVALTGNHSITFLGSGGRRFNLRWRPSWWSKPPRVARSSAWPTGAVGVASQMSN